MFKTPIVRSQIVEPSCIFSIYLILFCPLLPQPLACHYCHVLACPAGSVTGVSWFYGPNATASGRNC